MTLLQDLHRQIDILSSQVLTADFRGYDPYDIQHRLASIPDNVSTRLQRKAARIANRIAPLRVRRLLGIEPQLNPKALGLCLRAFALLHERETYTDRWYVAAERALDLLAQTRSKDYPMGVWGYPFDWRSRILIPKGTPSSVVNAIIADGLMEWYRVCDESRFLNMSCEICDFFVSHLNRSPGRGGSFCFSYTPLDYFNVHNANLFVAETLVKVGTVVGCREWIKLGREASEYALADQREDGSLSYWASDQMEPGKPQIDHYHSGFEIRMLYRLACLLRDQKLMSATRRYYDFYKQKLLHVDDKIVMPKYTPEKIYPVDIHSCAEFIIVNSELSKDEIFDDTCEILRRGSQWIMENMLDKNDNFYARIEDCGFFTLRVSIPYMRWGMAWMLLALVLCRIRLSVRDSERGVEGLCGSSVRWG